MRTLIKSATWIVLAIGSLCASVLAQAKPSEAAVSPPPVPYAREQGSIRPDPSVSPGRGLRGRIALDTLDQRIRVTWVFDNPDSKSPNFHPQRVSLEMWPTAATFTQGKLIVAGKTRKGETQIVAYTIDYPPLPLDFVGRYAATFRGSILYAGNQAGKRGVRFMLKNHGAKTSAGAVFLHFQDSNDVYSFDLGDRSWTLALASSDLPELEAKHYSELSSGNHPKEGFVYTYSSLISGISLVPLVLADRDRNGTIDTYYKAPQEVWDSKLGDPMKWIEIFD